MFIVYHSNQIELLKMISASIMKEYPIKDPFTPEIILVQNEEMSQWIKTELATTFGVAANIDCLLTECFIWKMCRKIIPNIPKKNTFSKRSITWKLISLFPKIISDPKFKILADYLKKDINQRKSFKLALEIAELYDKYLVYRPDWLNSWEQGKIIEKLGESQKWQAPLWQKIITHTKENGQSLWHRASLYQKFIQILESFTARPEGLPDRVFVFGSSMLSYYCLQALRALGRYTDIHILLINPCRHYWEDIQDKDYLTKQLDFSNNYQQKKLKKDLYIKSNTDNFLTKIQKNKLKNNSLLCSWGKLCRDKIRLLSHLNDVQDVSSFVRPSQDSILGLLQNDILELEINKNHILNPEDQSISIHICHSPQREVEVLYDNLLAMMADDSSIAPHDIIVMAENIDCYSPFIKSVFGYSNTRQYLPFFITNRSIKYVHPIFLTFLSLLELPDSRFTSEQVLSFLELPSIASRFCINEEGLILLRRWVSESGICWGLDDDNLQELSITSTSQNTWRFGLTRMFLGYAMKINNKEYNRVTHYNYSNDTLIELVGHLADFLEKLRFWKNYLSIPRIIKKWMPCVRKMIKDFFLPDKEIHKSLLLLESQWKKILESGLDAGYDRPITVSLLHDELAIWLNQKEMSQYFMTDTINFCDFFPSRPVSFKVICLLGMNDVARPYSISPTSFNLMDNQKRLGDLSKLDESRHFFLEILISAKKKLYISLIGRTAQDNTLIPPSSLIRDLIDYISKNFNLLKNKKTNIENNTYRVNDYICKWHSRTPFAPENFIPGHTFQTFFSEWLPSANNSGKKLPFFNKKLSNVKITTISLNELKQFYGHSVRAWFQKRLLIYFCEDSINIPENEPFVINSLTRYKINKLILNALINEEDNNKTYRQVRDSGILPFGAFGKLYWKKQYKIMNFISQSVKEHWKLKKYNTEIILRFGDVELNGWLTFIQENGLLRWSPTSLSMKDGLMLWIEHLIYCAMGGVGDSRMFGIGNQWHFPAMSHEQAKEYIVSFIHGYRQGMRQPLLLINNLGGAWLNACVNKKIKKINKERNCQYHAKNKLIQAWKGNDYFGGEKRDPYLRRLIRYLNNDNIKEIIEVTEKYLLPPFILNIEKKSKTEKV